MNYFKKLKKLFDDVCLFFGISVRIMLVQCTGDVMQNLLDETSSTLL